ncbi:hypothetical protein PHJA_000133400 [Phtheirospermum japonicum]|uniref:Uncharacterized protein n=1 Tax=Phtheirospermum japonicum TaxID=374723 RepID=A0A830AYJ1_9LAMI|nr:hypothetical protein PHJA_000133400 [Phtheirospermum japonicum]
MALATQHFKGSCSTLPFEPSSWSRRSKLKHYLPTFHADWTEDRSISLKCRLCSSIGASFVLGPKSKLSKISAFKGSRQYDDTNGIANGTKSLKNDDKVSYSQNRSEESSVVENSNVQNNVVPTRYTASDETTTTRFMAIHDLFKNWLMLLRMPSQTQPVEEVIEEPSSSITSEIQNTKRERCGIMLNAVWCNFLGLDATIKLPLLVFMPLYSAINLLYGSKVSKELMPLWILGPLIVALYIKTFRAMCGLYAFSFKQTVQVVKNVPIYYLLVHNYIVHGKLKEDILEPLADIKNVEYNDLTRRKMKDLQGCFLELYLDFVELIWPWYFRTTRFLKRANFI